jgi:uncharacterized protein
MAEPAGGRAPGRQGALQVGLISDTHGTLRGGVFEALEGVDLILHAGDVGSSDILVELEAIAPVHAVVGNTDYAGSLPGIGEEVRLQLAGRAVVLVHGHRLGSPTPPRLRAAFPDADIIVYGHTHRQRVDEVDGCLIINPGAAGPARFNLKPAVARLVLPAAGAAEVRHIEL